MYRLLSWLIFASLCLALAPGNAATSVAALLSEAETVRSSDPERFQRLLGQLEAANGKATAPQRDQIAYLHAYQQSYVGNYDVAIPALRRLATGASTVETRFRAGALMVNGYAVTRQFAEGLRQLEQTLELVERVKDPDLRMHGFGVAAVMYNEIGEYHLGLQYAERILAAPTNGRARCFAGQYRVEALWRLKRLPDDDALVRGAIQDCVSEGEAVIANLVRATLARKWAARGQGDKAIALLDDHLPEVESTRYARLIGEVHSLLAELLLTRGELAEADLHARAAISHGPSMPHSQPLVAAYKVLYEIANRRGNASEALSYYRRYADADKAYLNDVKTRELAYQFVRQETAQKTQQIELLNRQNQVLQLQQRVAKQNAQNTRLVVLLLLLVVAVLGYWASWIRRRQQSLRRFAETDALTGVSNRHHFTQCAEQVLAQCAKNREQVALVMFDLDRFKEINDTYGHATGDWVLREVAENCRGFCRAIDYIGRLGGEEFAFLLRGCDLAAATRLAEDCRLRLTRIDTRPSGHTFTVTASFGVSATASSGYGLDVLISHADRMLYRAKREGRNQVRAFTMDLPLFDTPRVDAAAAGEASHSAVAVGSSAS
ncbi:MAG TPA: GGDEF domain-containing protein [Lysobacter sp.]